MLCTEIGLVFGNGGFGGHFIGLRKMVFVSNIFLEFFLKTYCLSQHLKKKSPKVGELFSLSKGCGIYTIKFISYRTDQHILSRFPSLAIVTLLARVWTLCFKSLFMGS